MSASDFPRRGASGAILVGYVATDYGMDALRLGIALAKERNVRLEIVMVAPAQNSFSGVYPHDRGYDEIAKTWKDRIAKGLQPLINRAENS